MFNGQLACLGTIQHLKSKFSQGYTIEIKVRSTSNDTNMTTIQNVRTPADLFELLEQHKQNLNIEKYTISQTTLEQIFLSIGKKLDADLQ
ncbi:unnamed protein product [Rotaria sp. Silwood1]|nr:unnamed protein product [Rotaria sp. Silwood1]CAF4967261.1 unnamed protein product [Rotaria sp. Silwood1]CAF4982118.1 unnamed protein product [Rotaria sp. Silwood1]